MDISTAVAIAVVLLIGLWVPYLHLVHPSRESARTHLVHMVEAAGHSDIGPDIGGFRQTRPGADDARGARYCSVRIAPEPQGSGGSRPRGVEQMPAGGAETERLQELR